MSKMIQIRNVPDGIHATIKARAALAGMTLSDYLLNEIREIAERPTLAEIRQRLEALPKIRPEVSSADIIRDERDRR